jgi:hypothetical protein
MPYEAATGVVQAARRYRSGTEDFLTELFAAALAAHVPFAHSLCDEVDLPRGARHRVRTHVTERLPAGRVGFVDMEVEIQDSRGATLGELWAEHKTPGYGLREGQLADYEWALQRKPGRHALIAVVPSVIPVPDPPTARPRHAARSPTARDARGWRTVGWQRVAELCSATLEPEWGTGHRTAPATATRGQHLVEELKSYLEDCNMASTSPVDSNHVSSLKLMSATLTAISGLLESALPAIEKATGLKHDGGVDDWRPGDTDFCYYQAFKRSKRSWVPTDWDASPVVLIGDRWPEQELHEPFVAAGVWLPAHYATQVRRQAAWIGRLDKLKFTVNDYLEYLLVARTQPLSGFVKASQTLVKQRDQLATWAAMALSQIIDTDPDEKLRRPRRAP